MESNKKVLIYGGSYNPIHRGHINAALNAHNYLHTDEVWLMPRKYNYDKTLLLDSKYRLDMINLAIKDLADFKICKIELNDKDKSLLFTYNTAVKLTKKYPNIDFYFLIGADQLNNLPWWYEVDKLTQLFKFVCYRRPGYKIDKSIAKKYNIEIIDGVQIDASSTNVRSGLFDQIDDDIAKYINKHQLYLKERVMPLLSENRFIHVLSTARLAKKIAPFHNLSSNNAYVAGILHDIAKSNTLDETKQIVCEHYPKKKNYPDYCLHAYASAYIAKDRFGINNKEILKAIENHCRPTKNMSQLDKLIYICDKVEETRKFADEVAYIRELAYKDLDKAFIATLEDQIAHFEANEQSVDKNIKKILKYYKEKEIHGETIKGNY